MSKKTYVGNGQYCYTTNCKRHSQIREQIKKLPAGSENLVDRYSSAVSLIDRNHSDLKDYYKGTEKKHFSDPFLPGSKFTDPKIKTLEDILVLASIQRGSLEGDDREKFIKLGAVPEAFQPDSRYLLVETPGKLGIVDSSVFSDDVVVKVERTKPLAPCSFVAEVKEQPKVDFGIIVVSDYLGKERFITAFPGLPTVISKSKESAERVNSIEGKTFTISQAREMLGRDFTVHTRVI